ncbi:MAG TPA: ATP-binding protein [Bacteroidia bacterium]|jgi:serine/threonine-protein kinase RsbW|nr:ATP-binding protein [Bacteroidia bacterium]
MDKMQAEAQMVKELEITSNPERILEVEQFIEEIRDFLGFKDDVFGNVMIAVTEAVNNSIRHGNRGDGSKLVRIHCAALNPYRIMMAVEDEGTGFDPESLPDPTAPENVLRESGRGVFLMRQLSDEIHFQNAGRRVEMVFNI